MKIGLSQKKGIVLVSITEPDLTHSNFLNRIPEKLEVSVPALDHYLKALEKLAEDYIAYCRRARRRDEDRPAR